MGGLDWPGGANGLSGWLWSVRLWGPARGFASGGSRSPPSPDPGRTICHGGVTGGDPERRRGGALDLTPCGLSPDVLTHIGTDSGLGSVGVDALGHRVARDPRELLDGTTSRWHGSHPSTYPTPPAGRPGHAGLGASKAIATILIALVVITVTVVVTRIRALSSPLLGVVGRLGAGGEARSLDHHDRALGQRRHT